MRQIAGFGVHVFTALGSVCALLSMLAVIELKLEQAFGWLLVALAIDAVDGTLARAVDVERYVARFSGERLDLVIDFVTYVFIPVIAMLRGGVLSGLWGQVTAGLILLSALYHFADLASKADDKCFVGFPAVWNLVAFCFFAWATPPWLAMGISLILVVLAFVPMHWLHPMRVRRFLAVNVAVMAAGLTAAIWVLTAGFPAGPVAGGILGLASAYFVGMAILWAWVGGGAAAE